MDNYIEILGLLAGACTSIGFFPQLLKIWRSKSAQDISLVMYAVMMIGFAGWITYGFLNQAISVIITNIISFSFALIILGLKTKFDKSNTHTHTP